MEHKVINADVRNIGVTVVVIIRKGDKVLMGRRKGRHENVRDYTLTNPDYAKTYLFKADVLLDALFVRLSEINNHFGNSLGLIISRTFCRLEQEMGL